MGPTPTQTRTLGMRLSCNFVNGYTMAYRVQYTFTRVHARISNGHPRARKSARVGQVGGQVSEDRRACTARGKRKLNEEFAGHADFRARIPGRKSASMSVSVSVSVPWNLRFTPPLSCLRIVELLTARTNCGCLQTNDGNKTVPIFHFTQYVMLPHEDRIVTID